MAAAIGWYGPLIDLSRASSHVDDLVQLLVFVHHSQPVQKVINSKERCVLMTEIKIGDDTKPHFVLSVWHKYIGTMIAPGDIIFLQNVKIMKFREVLEAVTIQISLLTVLARCSDLVSPKDNNQVMAHLQLGSMAREKLNRVMHWINHTESTTNHVQIHTRQKQNKVPAIKNWKSSKDQKPTNCLSVIDVLCLRSPCTITFHAFIGEIFVPCSWKNEVKQQLSLTKALLEMDKSKITEALICMGCTACGFPTGSRLPLYCNKNSNFVHNISQIYRPFLLHVWDHAGFLPLLVKNRAASTLFGNLTAEMVKSVNNNSAPLQRPKLHSLTSSDLGGDGDDDRLPESSPNSENVAGNKPNFHQIWLMVIKALLKQQESPFQFEALVDKGKGIEDGRFELASLRMPCYYSGKMQ